MSVHVERRKRYSSGLRSYILHDFETEFPIRKCMVDFTRAGSVIAENGHYSITVFFDTEAEKVGFLQSEKEQFESSCNDWIENNVTEMGFNAETVRVFDYGSVEDIEANHGGDYVWDLH